MRIAVIGDIHANLPALSAVLEDVAHVGADALYASATSSAAARTPTRP